ncbi:MAG TPA: NAD(P)/FAD-dependent oxidoreductase [Acidimicrobiales bacterium]
METRHQVVVVGAGFGGLAVVRALRGQPVRTVLVDANNFHTFQPLLYQVATAGLDDDDIAYPVRGIFRRRREVEVRMARVTGIDLDAREVTFDRGEPCSYDSLVLAAGAVTATFGVPGVDEHGFGLKSVADALALRSHVLARFEESAATGGADGDLTVVIVGGGPTGVELAGGFVELFHKVLSRDHPSLDLSRVRVVLVEATDRLLGPFAPSLSERALRTLRRRGVEVLLGTGVAAVTAEGVELGDGAVIASRTVVWAAGVQASPLATSLPVERTRGGRLVVAPDLSLPGHPEVFAIGDVAASPDGGGGVLPQVAQVAMQGGRHAAAQIAARLDGRPTQPFRYHDKGSMATIGRHDAVAELPGGIRLSGFVGWVAWLGLHLLMLVGFRNRASVFMKWAWNYVTYDRVSRLLREDEIER